MALPDPNMRSVKRVDGVFTIARANEGFDDLCTYCGLIDTCKARQELQRLKREHGIQPSLRSCELYRPILGFHSEQGLGPFFNTFRKGTAWARRVRDGDTIALWNLPDREIMSAAEVKAVYSGRLEHMLGDHAHFNHLMLHGDRASAPEALHRILRRHYGSNWARLDGDFSVIYLRRCRERARSSDETVQGADLHPA